MYQALSIKPGLKELFPATVIPDQPFGDRYLETFATNNLDPQRIRCERFEDRHLRVYAPTPAAIWLMIEKLHSELSAWSGTQKAAGSSMMRRRFYFHNQLMMCADIAYLRAKARKKKYQPVWAPRLDVCPDFVMEVCSRSRDLPFLKEKMHRWVANGTKLAWLFVPQEECVFVYSSTSDPEIVDDNFLIGSGEFESFSVWTHEVWRLARS